MKPKEFEITLKLKVEADNLTVAECLATAIVNDLKKAGQEYVDRPINTVRWQRISPVFKNEIGAPAPGLSLVPRPAEEFDEVEILESTCPGCIDCGPPIVVKAEDACGRAK